ncbi:hypothetical protein CBM2615_A120155 [Cupriavidus taiwanensis]|uniref:Uncharacterized protein n=1 Tax=Cupriavidus taiwanensis TaxID=164546 RepID=A0A976AT59_9BURK|nr:hypothetical protein CBM2615_A120155 [Cupriavidus taiwanensis]SOZ49396.1 hypothetical protein CBM2614_A120153 [Cupriavidus taiwanensis]SOZ51995.1 hypothetical protein CBM2613_A110154 [Cupriavidus taiwanensis]SPA07163.1 hypothetical protein CBM2625_A90152 [Cupriavidus taiwanensis]
MARNSYSCSRHDRLCVPRCFSLFNNSWAQPVLQIAEHCISDLSQAVLLHLPANAEYESC